MWRLWPSDSSRDVRLSSEESEFGGKLSVFPAELSVSTAGPQGDGLRIACGGTALDSGLCRFRLQPVARMLSWFPLTAPGMWRGGDARTTHANYLSGASYLEAEPQLPRAGGGGCPPPPPLCPATVGTFQGRTWRLLPAGMPGSSRVCSLDCFHPLPMPPPPPASGPCISRQI